MAYLDISNVTDTTFVWYCGALESLWNSNKYRRIALTTRNVPNDSSTPPSGFIDDVYPPTPSSSNNYYTPERTKGGMAAGRTYTLYANALSSNNRWYNIGSPVTFTMEDPLPPQDTTSPRISEWFAENSGIGTTSVRMWAKASDYESGMHGFQFYLNGRENGSKVNDNYGSTTFGTYYEFTGLEEGTSYDFGVIAYDVNSNSTYPIRIYNTSTKARPSKFSWTYPKTSGGNFNLTAREWNNFASNINDVRAFKGQNLYGFTQATTGTPLYAYMYNQAVTALSQMSYTIEPPPKKSTGDLIYASYLNTLVSSLNSVK